MKLLIGVPSLDFVHIEFVKSLNGLTERLHRDRVPFELYICNGTLAHVARDRVACHAINNGFDRVLWLDADMVFTPDLYDDLAGDGRPFITGLAASRRPPFMLCVFKEMSEQRGCKNYELNEIPKEPFRIAGCGFACVLIETEILRAVQLRYKSCFLPESIFGEDLAFCRRASSMGHQIWCDPLVRVGHIGHNAVWPEDHETYMKSLTER